MNRLASVILATAMMTLVASAQERVGTSQADLPSFSGAFSIQNTTGVTIFYQVKWGADSAWKQIMLLNGHTETHSYPLGQDVHGKAPSPYVRFDHIAGDGQFEPKEYHMQFTAVGYAGFGPNVNRTQPKQYAFQFGPDRRSLDLVAR